MKKYGILIFAFLTLLSCSEYQKLLKSTDVELKYNKAVEYYDKGEYVKATTLFDEVSTYFRGTGRSSEILNYIAKSYAGQKDYYSASEYYKVYLRSYPKGKHAAEAKFMLAFCYYEQSPDARLNQESTKLAIETFQEFIDVFPDDEMVPEANRLIEVLKDKLVYKEFLNAKLYYNLGNYLGWNNYLSATIVAKNTLKKYPGTSHREDLEFLILEAKYQQALQSAEEKEKERYLDTLDEYYSFIAEHPTGKYSKQAVKIFKAVQKKTN